MVRPVGAPCQPKGAGASRSAACKAAKVLLGPGGPFQPDCSPFVTSGSLLG